MNPSSSLSGMQPLWGSKFISSLLAACPQTNDAMVSVTARRRVSQEKLCLRASAFSLRMGHREESWVP